MKNVFIDGRMYSHTGIGRFLRNRLHQLENNPVLQSGTLFLPKGCSYHSKKFKTIYGDTPLYSAREQLKLNQLTNIYKPDLYFSPHYILPFPGAGAKSFVATIHDLSHYKYGVLKKNIARLYLHHALDKVKYVITVSRSVKKQIAHFFPKYGGEIVVIPNGIEEFFFHRVPEDNIKKVLSKYTLPDKYWLTSGGKKAHKNVHLLENMRSFLPREYQSIPIVVLGNYRLKKPFIRKNLYYMPYIEDRELPPLYHGAELFLFPSLSEGFGLPVLEALACETPVVCSNIPAHLENYSEVVSFFNPANPKDAADAVARVLQSSGLRQEMKENGRKTALRYSWSSTAHEFIEVLKHAYENRHCH